MNKKSISLLGVLLGVIAGALIAIISGSWMFWLALGVALGLVLGSFRGRHGRQDLSHGAGI